MGRSFQIINRKSEQELNVHSKDADTPIVATTDGKHTHGALEKEGDAFIIRSRHSDRIVDVADESRDRRAPVVQYPNQAGRNQFFELEPVRD